MIESIILKKYEKRSLAWHRAETWDGHSGSCNE